VLPELTQDQLCCGEPCYRWAVSNKYYSATLLLHWVGMPLETKSFSKHSYGAVVLVLDNSLVTLI